MNEILDKQQIVKQTGAHLFHLQDARGPICGLKQPMQPYLFPQLLWGSTSDELREYWPTATESVTWCPACGRISKEQFKALCDELERLEMSIAKGQDTPESDLRIREIERITDAAPWMLDPDTGQVIVKQVVFF